MSEGATGGVRCMMMRGGTSKGAYFLAADLPADASQRDRLLLALMGSPDARQIDGLGGAHPLTSKVAVVSAAGDEEADVDYLFLQVSVDEAVVTDRQNCGNILAGVGPFALERGLVPSPGRGPAHVRIRMLNTGGVATATVETVGGRVRYDGATAIAGVPGTAAPVRIDFEGTAGSSCGALLPSGRLIDVICDVPVTLIDNGMPVVVMRAADVGIAGDEGCAELEADGRLRQLLEAVRLEAGPRMGLGDVTATTVPKLTMVSPPQASGALSTRTFIPHRCHDAIGVLGAVSVATAALLPGTPAAAVARIAPGSPMVEVEHPTGAFSVAVELEMAPGDAAPVGGEMAGAERVPGGEHVPLGEVRVRRAGIVQTARKLMDGVAYPAPR